VFTIVKCPDVGDVTAKWAVVFSHSSQFLRNGPVTVHGRACAPSVSMDSDGRQKRAASGAVRLRHDAKHCACRIERRMRLRPTIKRHCNFEAISSELTLPCQTVRRRRRRRARLSSASARACIDPNSARPPAAGY
jgi:hypothetical protein